MGLCRLDDIGCFLKMSWRLSQDTTHWIIASDATHGTAEEVISSLDNNIHQADEKVPTVVDPDTSEGEYDGGNGSGHDDAADTYSDNWDQLPWDTSQAYGEDRATLYRSHRVPDWDDDFWRKFGNQLRVGNRRVLNLAHF